MILIRPLTSPFHQSFKRTSSVIDLIQSFLKWTDPPQLTPTHSCHLFPVIYDITYWRVSSHRLYHFQINNKYNLKLRLQRQLSYPHSETGISVVLQFRLSTRRRSCVCGRLQSNCRSSLSSVLHLPCTRRIGEGIRSEGTSDVTTRIGVPDWHSYP